MGIKKILLLSILAMLAVSCASTTDTEQVEEVYVPTFKTLSHKGFTLVVPDDTGWNVAKETEYKVELAKRAEASDDVYTSQALLVRLPAFESDEDFKAYVEKSMNAIDQKTQSTIIDQGSNFIPYNDNQCVQINRKTEKSAGSSEEGAAPMVLEMVNFTCRHPLREDAGVYLAYAKRSQAGGEEEDLVPQALNLFYNLEFTDL